MMREPCSLWACWTSRRCCVFVTRSMPHTECSTDKQARDYFSSNYLPAATSSEMAQLMTLYPSDVTQGSPYDTGTSNALTPQFKRLASMQGDLVFQGPRRFFLQQVSGRQNTWSFRELYSDCPRMLALTDATVTKRFKYLPFVGSVSTSLYCCDGQLTSTVPSGPCVRPHQCLWQDRFDRLYRELRQQIGS